MVEKKRLIRGSSNFHKLVSQNGYFVDKTLVIQEVIDDPHETILIPRPRRFGKSMNLSILEYFFDLHKKDTAQLFEPFKIWQAGDSYKTHQGKYPVIAFTLKNINVETFKDCMEKLKIVLSDLYLNYTYLLDSNALASKQKRDFENILNETAGKIRMEAALKRLSTYLKDHHQQPVVILIDEYDTPIQQGYQNGFYTSIVKFMKSFLGDALKENDTLFKAVVTGILRVSKESIFSQLNNVEVYALMDNEFADKFGFTEEETVAMLQYFQLEDNYQLIKSWYDGYRIGELGDIYNPWSITGYIAKKGKTLEPHWINTSGDELIKHRMIERNADTFRKDIVTLLSDGVINKSIDKRIIFPDFQSNQELFWSLLTFSGYLTSPQWQTGDYQDLKIPNYEIRQFFLKNITKWFAEGLKVNPSLLLKMIDHLKYNRIKEFEYSFKAIMGDTFSYFDLEKPDGKRKNKEAENVWHAYTLGLLAAASEAYIIKSNRESGGGRYDILMLPKDRIHYGVLFELKVLDKKATQEDIDTQLEDALMQIEKNEYYKELIAHNVPKRIEIAVVFVGKKVFMRARNA